MFRISFIPLKLNMTYSIGGHSISMADGTIHLGTFVRNSLEHPDLFSFRCPKCGEPLYPYGYSGSPLSGRVDLQGYCDCGWGAFVVFSGWKVRSEALKATQGSDRLRLAKYRALKPLKGPSATIQELLGCTVDFYCAAPWHKLAISLPPLKQASHVRNHPLRRPLCRSNRPLGEGSHRIL